MFITYRRTGGIFALLTFGAVALAVTLVTVAVAATLLVVTLTTAAAVLLLRAVLPRSWRARTVRWVTPSRHGRFEAAPSPHDTFEATVVTPRDATVQQDLVRIDRDKEMTKP